MGLRVQVLLSLGIPVWDQTPQAVGAPAQLFLLSEMHLGDPGDMPLEARKSGIFWCSPGAGVTN